MSFSPPSLVSPTSALTDRTLALPGCASVHRTTPFHGRADAEGVGEHDRRLDRAELVDLRGAGELAEGVADEHGAGAPSAGTDCRRAARTAVTPVRTASPLVSVTWPTRTPVDVGDGVAAAPARTRRARGPDRARAAGRPAPARRGAQRQCRHDESPRVPACASLSTSPAHLDSTRRPSPGRRGPRDTIGARHDAAHSNHRGGRRGLGGLRRRRAHAAGTARRAVRTPGGRRASRGLPQARVPAADRLLQAARRLQRRAPARRRRSWPAACGR